MSERLVMAHRFGRDDDEAEPVCVEREGALLRLVLDDGDTLEFDAVELRAALEEAA